MPSDSAIRREVGAVALMFTGLGSIIGSGWLFGAWRAAQLAGPGAIYAWIIGAVVILFVALTYAELGAMFPESGGAVRYGHYSHGSLVGFVAGWAAWIAIVSVIPVEAEASVQYMSSWPWTWAQGLYVHAANGQGELTRAGPVRSAPALVVIYFLLNFWSVKVFAGTNSAITFFKLIVPAATAIALMCTGFHRGNFQRRGPRRPARGQSRLDPHRGRDQRHRVQLQRLPEPGQSRRRGAQSRPQHSRSRSSDPSALQHRGLPAAAGRVSGRGCAGPPARRLGGARIQLAVRAARARDESQLAGAAAVCRRLRQPERHRHHLHRHHRAHDLRHGAQRHVAARCSVACTRGSAFPARPCGSTSWCRSSSCSSSAAGASSPR